MYLAGLLVRAMYFERGQRERTSHVVAGPAFTASCQSVSSAFSSYFSGQRCENAFTSEKYLGLVLATAKTTLRHLSRCS